MIETLKTIASIAGSAITISTCGALLIKPVRSYLISKMQDSVKDSNREKLILEIRDILNIHIEQDKYKQENYEIQNEALIGIIRDNITKIYFKYLDSKTIPSYDKENLIRQYTVYHRMHGNTYIDVIYPEMLEWDVIKE